MNADNNAKGRAVIGRPRLPAKKRRTAFVKVYLTPAEKSALSRLADAEGVTLAEFIRRALKLKQSG